MTRKNAKQRWNVGALDMNIKEHCKPCIINNVVKRLKGYSEMDPSTSDKIRGCADGWWATTFGMACDIPSRRIIMKAVPRQLVTFSLFPHFRDSVWSLTSPEPPLWLFVFGVGNKHLSSTKHVTVEGRWHSVTLGKCLSELQAAELRGVPERKHSMKPIQVCRIKGRTWSPSSFGSFRLNTFSILSVQFLKKAKLDGPIKSSLES